jgi:hypothetical protein
MEAPQVSLTRTKRGGMESLILGFFSTTSAAVQGCASCDFLAFNRLTEITRIKCHVPSCRRAGSGPHARPEISFLFANGTFRVASQLK